MGIPRVFNLLKSNSKTLESKTNILHKPFSTMVLWDLNLSFDQLVSFRKVCKKALQLMTRKARMLFLLISIIRIIN